MDPYTSAPVPGDVQGHPDAARASSFITTTTPPPGRLWAFALAAGASAGLLAWLIGEQTLTAFRPPMQEIKAMGMTLLSAKRADEVIAETRNIAIAFGLLGSILGLALGVAGNLARRPGSAGGGWKGAVVGLVAGGAAGVAMSYLILPSYYRFIEREPLSSDLTVPLMTHAAIWAVIGAAAGLGFGLGVGGRGEVVRALAGGLIGAALGALVFELTGAFFLPMAKTTQPLAATMAARLLARVIIGVFTAAGAALLVATPLERPARAT